LTRSLVAGALLADRSGVEVHMGFKAPEVGEEVIDGHAWVAVDGRSATAGEDAKALEDSYVRVVSIPMHRRGT